MMAARRRPIAARGFLAVVFVGALCSVTVADDAVADGDFRPPPPLETELSRVKGVSIMRVEEKVDEDGIWGDRREFWRYQQHSHRFGRVRVKEETMLQILCGAAEVSPLRVYGAEALPDGRYNIDMQGSPRSTSAESSFDKLADVLGQSFDVTIKREVREVSVLTLRWSNDAQGKPGKNLPTQGGNDHSQSISTSSHGDGVTEVEYQGSLNSFVEYLEELLDEAIVNQVKRAGQVTLRFDHESVPDIDDYDYEAFSEETLVELRRRRLEDIDKGLRKYGLTLAYTKQRIKGVFITAGFVDEANAAQESAAATE